VRVPAGIIDVGSNTVRLLVAREDRGLLVPTCTQRVRVGLGEEIEREGRLSEVKLAAAAKAVRKLSARARAVGADRVDVIVTAPGRQAANAGELVAVLERAARAPVRRVSADDEARLAFAGAVAVGAPTADLVAVCDLGGASTELAVGAPAEGEPRWLRSTDLGALRLTTRIDGWRLSPPDALPLARREVEAAFAGIAPPLPGDALAVGGTARALRKLVGPTLNAGTLGEAVELLTNRSHRAIARDSGIDRPRVRLMLAGALILAEVQQRLAVPLRVVDGGLREGALLRALERIAA
jgi:exopolyphosphatase/guanosine-5'-triphosphate,3'-diphosphate pyrophosphatase